MSRKTLVGVLIAAAIAAPAIASAQMGLSKGIKVGLNLSTLTGTDSELEGFSKSVRIGVAGGIFGAVEIPASPLAVELDALYSMKGAKYTMGNLVATAEYDYLDIPLLLRYDAGKSPARISIYVGPSLGVLLGATWASDAGDQDLKASTKSTELGLVVGAGVGLAQGITGDVRYAFGLSTISEPGSVAPDEVVHNGLLQVLLGYSF